MDNIHQDVSRISDDKEREILQGWLKQVEEQFKTSSRAELTLDGQLHDDKIYLLDEGRIFQDLLYKHWHRPKVSRLPDNRALLECFDYPRFKLGQRWKGSFSNLRAHMEYPDLETIDSVEGELIKIERNGVVGDIFILQKMGNVILTNPNQITVYLPELAPFVLRNCTPLGQYYLHSNGTPWILGEDYLEQRDGAEIPPTESRIRRLVAENSIVEILNTGEYSPEQAKHFARYPDTFEFLAAIKHQDRNMPVQVMQATIFRKNLKDSDKQKYGLDKDFNGFIKISTTHFLSYGLSPLHEQIDHVEVLENDPFDK